MKISLAAEAKLLRILFLPPAVVAFFLFTVYRTGYPARLPLQQVLLSLVFLTGFPLLAYPVSLLRRSWRCRTVQRKIAFLFCGAGYLAGALLGGPLHFHPLLVRLQNVYLVSYLFLLLLNRFGSVRPSGHACSITGPLIWCVLFYGSAWELPALLVYCSVLWSSVYLKRHTVREFLLGSMTSAIPALLLIRV